jgi:hypothetical protein
MRKSSAINLSINAAFPGALAREYNTTDMLNGKGPFEPTAIPDVGDLALLRDPGHVVFVTGVNNGSVTSFQGSQNKTGPAKHWEGKSHSFNGSMP